MTANARGASIVRVALVVLGVAVAWFWWTGTPRQMGSTPGTALLAGGELVGLLASVLVCVQLLLVAHVPWFERTIGPGAMGGWHASLGTTAALLVLSHVVAMVVGSELVDHRTPWRELATLLSRTADLPLALAGAVLLLLVAVTSARVVRAWLGRRRWYWVHVTAYVGVYLAFFHQVAAGAHFVADPVARGVWIALYAATGVAVLRWRVGPAVLRHVRHGAQRSAA